MVGIADRGRISKFGTRSRSVRMAHKQNGKCEWLHFAMANWGKTCTIQHRALKSAAEPGVHVHVSLKVASEVDSVMKTPFVLFWPSLGRVLSAKVGIP